MDKPALMFPGVGSQFIGMGKELYKDFKCFRDIVDKASSILSVDFFNIFYNSEKKDILNQNLFAQLSLFTYSIASYQILVEELNIDWDICLGHSLGEYSGLCVAGHLSFENTLKLIKQRGEFIEKCSDTEGSMMWVINIDTKLTEEICNEGLNSGLKVYISSVDAPVQCSISGITEDLYKLVPKFEKNGAIVYPIYMSGPFHSPLMNGASEKLGDILLNYKFNESNKKLVANINAKPYSNDPKSVIENLSLQLNSTIQWRGSIEYIINQGISSIIEVGPKEVLGYLTKKNSPNIKVHKVNDLLDIKQIQKQYDTSPQKQVNKEELQFSLEQERQKEYYFLTPYQRRLFYASLLDTSTTRFNTTYGIIITGEERQSLSLSINKVLKNNPLLSASFDFIDGAPIMVLNDDLSFIIEDLGESVNGYGLDVIFDGFIRGFNLSNPPLIRVGQVMLSDNKFLFLVDFHSILADKRSVNSILDNVSKAILDKGLKIDKEVLRRYTEENKIWVTENSGMPYELELIDINTSIEATVQDDLKNCPTETNEWNSEIKGVNFKIKKELHEEIMSFAFSNNFETHLIYLVAFILILKEELSLRSIPIVLYGVESNSEHIGCFDFPIRINPILNESMSSVRMLQLIQYDIEKGKRLSRLSFEERLSFEQGGAIFSYQNLSSSDKSVLKVPVKMDDLGALISLNTFEYRDYFNVVIVFKEAIIENRTVKKMADKYSLNLRRAIQSLKLNENQMSSFGNMDYYDFRA